MQLEKLPSIWTESPLTIPYVAKGATIDKSKRFEFNSIYHKDDPFKPKKKVDQLLFPMKVLQDFRKNIKEAGSKSIEKLTHKRGSSTDEMDESKSMIGRKAESITKRLYQRPDKLKEERDMFGNRCSMNEREFEEVVKLPSFTMPSARSRSNQKLYITASQRLNLGRPSNFNPGPGAYLKETISVVNGGKHNLSSSIHSEVNVGGGLRRKPRDRFMLESIETRNLRSLHQ